MDVIQPIQQTSDLVLYVNGNKIVKPNPHPRTILADFLRKELKLTGTKISCAEGGCGACTVLISKCDRKSSKILHYAANACLTPLCSLHGLAVTTVEAIGSTRTKLHPIQEKLVSSHGVQCGFCSPGMVMSMFALLRNNQSPTVQQVEHALKGNLCRCTGYRPILDAFNSFAQQGSNEGECPMADQCCRKSRSQENQSSASSSECKGSDGDNGGNLASQELIFPSSLQLSDECDRTSLYFESVGDIVWYRPVLLDELLAIKERYQDAVLIAGGSSVAFMLKNQQPSEKPTIVVATSGVKELMNIRHNEEQLFIGAQTSMAQLETELNLLSKTLPAEKTQLVGTLLDVLKVFASPQIRNAATMGGSLALSSPSADINSVLLVSDCRVELASSSGGKRVVAISDFLAGRKRTCLLPNEIILNIIIPLSSVNEYYGSFKQSPRVDLSLGDVVSAIYVKLTDDAVVEAIRLSIGGVAMSSLKLIKAVDQLIGRKWSDDIFEAVLSDIFAEIKSETASDDTNRYHMVSLEGFLMKFGLQVSAELDQQQGLSESDQLYMDFLSRRKSATHAGVQVYDVQPRTSDTDAVGQPLHHKWAKQCATGEAVFTDDLLPSEGELYVELVGSSKANARIVELDVSEVLSTPGVVGFLDHTSVPGANRFGFTQCYQVFASEQVSFVNEVIGAVVASSPPAAKLGAAKVRVEYEELGPVITTIEEAIEKNSFFTFPPGMGSLKRGDSEAALKKADHVIEREVRIGGQEHFYMETHGARVVPKGEDGEMDVYVGTQVTSWVQEDIARALNIDANRVTVHMKRMGGAFGGKERVQLVTVPAAVAANKFNRPARCILSRRFDMQVTGHRRPYLFRYKIGFNSDGRIVALDVDLYSNEGCNDEFASGLLTLSLATIDGCYAIPNISARSHMCKTHLQSRCAMRAAGSVQPYFFIENVLRDVAYYLKMPAHKVQLLNVYQTGQLTIGNIPVEDTLGRCFDQVLKQSDYVAEYQRIVEFNEKSKHVKRGLAVVPMRFTPSLPSPWNQGSAQVHIYLDGSVLLTHGGHECGQGLNTKMIQVASRALEAPIENIHMSETSTSTSANSSTTGGSSGSDICGAAVLNACKPLADRLRPYKLAKPDGTWKEWVNAAYKDRVSLSSLGHWGSSFTEDYDMLTDQGQFREYNTFGVGVTQIELDSLTGNLTIPRVDIVMDIGKSLNPALDVGQIEGGFVMGLGLFTSEDHRYDAVGRLETIGAGKYYVPTVSSVPQKMNVTILKDSANQFAVYSSKGVGEPPLLISISAFFAIKEAVAAVRADAGLSSEFVFDSPATVSRILLASSCA